MFVGRYGHTWRQPVRLQPLGFLSSGLAAYALTADTGEYTVSGQSAGLLKNSALTGETGAYTLSGQAAALLTDYVLTASVGVYVLTGQDATLTAAGRYELTCDAGAYTLTGQSVVFTVTPRDCGKITPSLMATGAMIASLSANGKMSTRLWPRC